MTASKAQLEAAREEIINRRVEEEVAKRMAAVTAQVTAAQHVQEVQPEPAAADVGSIFENLPSPSRVIVGFVLGLAAAGATGYGVGTLMSMALAGIATLTGSAALAFMLTALTWVLGIYAGWKLSAWAGSKVFSSIVLPDGLVSRCCDSLALGASGVKNAVVDSTKKSSLAQRVAAFTGAHTVETVDVVRAA